MGIVHQNSGDYDMALELYQKALEIAKKVGDIAGVASSIGMIGKVMQNKKQYKDAFIDFLISLDIFEKLGSPKVDTLHGFITELTREMGDEDFNKLLDELKDRS